MGLVDLGQSGVDDLLVKLLLLFEAEDLGGLGGKDVHDPVEHRIVEIRVVHGHGFDALVERNRQIQRGLEAGK